ncbi:WD40 repeat-like protein [Viridothelium virens]|uniref:WD40 repeat-like protein n=1 Tax=Viridothelium virens TaxID=1048519 RepID=A0A6A6HME0_VIRVR|nr:WD40 repeat-like protein [Viridothelium virens]
MSSPIRSTGPSIFSPEQPRSSPLRLPSSNGSRKARKPPNITPKRFTRFFTPRSSVASHKSSGRLSRSGRQLRDITRDAINGAGTARSSSSGKRALFEDIKPSQVASGSTQRLTSHKRRRTSPPPLDSSPPRSSPCHQSSDALPPILYSSDVLSPRESIEDDYSLPSPLNIQPCPEPVKRVRNTGVVAQDLQRSFGGHDCVGRGSRQEHCTDWQYHTQDFYSTPSDRYRFASPALPFCTKSCNTNSLVAFGDEEGSIRLIDSAKDCHEGFSRAHVTFRPHANAIMDLAFSPDDLRLVVGSGDQTSTVIDMQTQQTIYTMPGHSSSVKQVAFQPGQDRIVATSGRDGSIRLWDTRCRDRTSSQVNLRTSFESQISSGSQDDVLIHNAALLRSIPGAHAVRQPLTPSQGAENVRGNTRSASLKGESPSRVGDVSITALSFLPVGREHLLMTASEANAVVKLWDIRLQPKSRHRPILPISVTKEPESHIRHRPFGINSLSLSGDGARFYALCRDSTVYAYSTNHLILGSAPEYCHASKRKARARVESKEGLGPIYGFRHPKLLATTFYIKSSLRAAKNDRSEVLAVGSSDGCAILFPTEEIRAQDSERGNDYDNISPALPSHPRLGRGASATSIFGRPNDNVPIHQKGTALIRGHQKEVTSLTWTADGDLVSVGDDYVARCWREGSKARELRRGGELHGQRWDCGWADTEDFWDDEDC